MSASTALREALDSRGGALHRGGIRVVAPTAAADGWASDARQMALLRLAFECLIDNACEAAAGQDDGTLEVDCAVDGSVCRFTFRDTGCGIREEDLPSVFDPFFSTKPGHAGLGLPICRTVMEKLGGRVFVAATGERGSRVVVELPRPSVRRSRRRAEARA